MKPHILEIIKGYNEEKKYLWECWYLGGDTTRSECEKRVKEIDELLVGLSKA